MINNKELIIPLLSFENAGDFYMLYIFKRKKDQEIKENKQSVRTIKTYCIDSLEYLEKRWEEMVHLCEYFGARAYIHIQKQNHKDVGLNMLVELATRLKDGAINQRNLFDSVVGQLKTYEKKWVVDVDSKKEGLVERIEYCIELCKPDNLKIITKIPTRNGMHIITCPFDVQEFSKNLKAARIDLQIDIQKKNPTLLYFPESLK